MNKREEILDLAKKAVNGERQDTYGSPEDNFNRIALLWSAYLKYPINDVDVAKMMILLKIARTQENREHPDNWADIAGYAACAGEIEYGHFHLGGAEKKKIEEIATDHKEAMKEAVEAYARRVREGEF